MNKIANLILILISIFCARKIINLGYHFLMNDDDDDDKVRGIIGSVFNQMRL